MGNAPDAVGQRTRRPLAEKIHRPAIPVLVALAAGILADHWLNVSLVTWLMVAIVFFTGGILWDRLSSAVRMASAFLLIAMGAAGAARHHVDWSTRGADNVAAIALSTSQPCRIRGTIASGVDLVESPHGPRIPSWMELDRSVCLLDCESIQNGTRWEPVSGWAHVEVSGHLVHVGCGDVVEIVGQLSVPGPAHNAGGGSYRDFLRSQGADAILRADHPSCVLLLKEVSGPRWTIARARERIRAACQSILASSLRPSDRALASSLLLGDRSQMTEDLRKQFVNSGTMHLLAISGLHVGILLGLLLLVCRLLNLSSRTTCVTLIVCALLYCLLTNHRPPVLRATILATLALVGTLGRRQLDGMNNLAVCGVVLLLWRSSDLFDVGAQLSFLAVAAILWTIRLQELRARADDPHPLQAEPSPLRQRLQPAWRWLRGALGVTAAIWIVTLPLTVNTFHLAAPIGLLLNIVLIPLTTLVLACGYLLLLCGMLFPWATGPIAASFAASLHIMQWLVGLGAKLPMGHGYLPQLPLWWVIGFYIIIAWAWMRPARLVSFRRGSRGVLAWVALGLAWGLIPSQPGPLRCTFLSVGHGLATVLELPGGKTVLYDAGTIGNGGRAERAVQSYLWSRGIQNIDAVIVSHADHDHYSGLFGILETFSIGALLIPQTFLDSEQPNTLQLCELAAQQGTSLRILQEGDRIKLPGSAARGAQLEVLHPSGGFRSRFDNANSVVLDLQYLGRRILLTGDLEKDGLAALLEQESRPADVLLAPHHGGLSANVPELFAWARPSYVVVSSGASDSISPLQETAAPARVLATATSGAITIEIPADGSLQVSEFLDRGR